jgi:hypothetical protein
MISPAMRHALFFAFSLTVVALSLIGCRSSRPTVTADKPRAQATRMPGFEPQAHQKIAVLVRDNADLYYPREDGMRRRVEDAFEQAAARKGYRLATRSQVEAIKEEIDFQSGTPWTEEGGAERGHLHNVSALLIASINEVHTVEKPSRISRVPDPERDGFFSKLFDNVLDSAPRETRYSEASLSADLISVREGEMLWSGSYTGAVQVQEDQPESKAIPAVSRVVARALPSR